MLKSPGIRNFETQVSKTKLDRKRPLMVGETEKSTIGCRHSNPNICAKNRLVGVCAFVNKDNHCNAPPLSWKKLYKTLLEVKEWNVSGQTP